MYGPGCARCTETEKRVRRVVEMSGVEAEVAKTTDIVALAKAGVLATPAVAVNGVIKLAGRIPNEDEIQAWISEI